MTYSGEIIYWDKAGWYGFIKYADSDGSIFFHKNNLNKNYGKVSLLDKVTFRIGLNQKGEHKGKSLAIDVKFISKGNFGKYQRSIGVLRDWDSEFGILNSPQLDKIVSLKHTRLLNTGTKIQNGDLFTFSPVKSTKKTNELFTFFAYPLEKEEDLEFLRQQKKENDIAQIERVITTLIRRQNKPIKERFELELREILESTSQNNYIQILELLNYYESYLDFVPSSELLTKKIPKVYLIQFWENDVINTYDLKTMIGYFHNSSADTKRAIINKFVKEDKIKILREHFNLLLKKGKLRKINNDVKTFLDIVHRNKKTEEPEIYKELKKYFLEHLTPKECVALWFSDYIDDLPESYIVDNFDITKALSFKKENEKHQRIVLKIYKNYLLTFAEKKDFEAEYPELIQYLKNFKEQFESDFMEVAKASIARLSAIQKIILWIFEPSLPFEGQQFLEDCWGKLNVYFLLKYLIRNKIKPTTSSIKEKADSITESKLIDFVVLYKWNSLITPVNKPDEDSFLNDVALFIEKFERLDINLDNLANTIFDSIPLYTTHHLQLWIFEWVEETRYDYVGFSEEFKKLTPYEQKEFRKKGDTLIKEEIKEGELLEVVPCVDIISTDGDTTVYKALVENIFFRDGSIQLRLKNKEYTSLYMEDFASSGFNRISKSSSYCQFEFILTVKNKGIVEATGFEDFFASIHMGEIERALGRTVLPESSRNNQNKSYVEDWKLRKEVIDYLNGVQFKEYQPKIVGEPKKRYRRLDVEVKPDNYEKTHLYSIETHDGLGIVWENIDLTQDRATFVFKTLRDTHNEQISKIASSIVSFGQFRSTLISTKSDDKLQIFKNNLGYVAKIHKQRGKNKPFPNWKGKLEKYLMLPIPDLPTNEQVISLKGWQIDMPHSSPKLRKIIKKIDKKTVKVTDVDLGNANRNRNRNRNRTENNILTPSAKSSILKKLQEINKIIQKK